MDITVTPGFSFLTKDDCVSNINPSGCCVCREDHETEKCEVLNNLIHVKDSKVPPRALLTLPTNLRMETLADGTKTVIAEKIFRKGTQFGPFEAKRLYAVNPFDSFPLKVFGEIENILPLPDCYLDTRNEEHCNWMCYISPASNLEEQNLICYQLNNDIFYSCIKEILPGEQLKVWYSPYYALKIGINVHSKKDTSNEFLRDAAKIQEVAEKLPASQLGAKEKQSWCCRFCNQIETNVVKYAKHLQKHYQKMIENLYTCYICNAGFSTQNLLTKHQRMVHIVFTGSEPEPNEDSYPVFKPDAPKIDLIETCMPLPIDNLINETLADSDPSLMMLDQLNLTSSGLYNDLNDVDTLRAILCDDNTKASKTAQENSIADFSLDFVESNEIPKIQKMQPPYNCDICDKQFNMLINLRRHLSKHAGVFTCIECLQVFSRKENYKRHPCVISDNYEQSYNCSLCQKSFLQIKYLRRHIQRHSITYTCTCGKNFKSLSSKNDHNCPQNEKQFMCEFCDKQFTVKVYLQRHLRTVHGTKKTAEGPNARPIVCEICAESFKSLKVLKSHKLSHSEPKFQCNICDKKFHKPYTYQNHLLTHEVPRYSCSECKKKFKTKKAVAAHSRTHNKNKEFVCNSCGLEFTQRICLQRHLTKKHNNKGKIQCDQCSKVFLNKYSLLNHETFVHNKNQGEYKCTKCVLRFDKKYLLTRHTSLYHSNKTYICQYCNHSFKQRSSLRRHLNQNHSNNREEWDNKDFISQFSVEKSIANSPESYIEGKIQESINNLINIEEETDSNKCFEPEVLLSVPETPDEQITLGKNAFILEDGTIVQPQEEGDIMFYVINQDAIK